MVRVEINEGLQKRFDQLVDLLDSTPEDATLTLLMEHFDISLDEVIEEANDLDEDELRELLDALKSEGLTPPQSFEDKVIPTNVRQTPDRAQHRAATVIGLYDHVSQARAAIRDLVDVDFKRDSISFTANASAAEYREYFDEEERYREDAAITGYSDDDEMTSDEGASAGAGIGATIGGLGGLLTGLGLLAVPGVGPALAAGPIVSALVGAGIGGVAGGLIGALVNSGVPEEKAGHYSEGVRRGGSLVMLTVEYDRVDDVERIMNEHDPVDIDERVAQWREHDDYERHDPDAEPYTAEQVAAEQKRYTVSVIEEDVKIGKREVSEGGKRIHSYVSETPVEEQVTLHDEEVYVERRDADKAFQEKLIEMTETDEGAVIFKEARVTSEVVVEKDVSEHTETVSDTVRKTEVEVVDIDTRATTNYGTDVDVYREHYDQTYAGVGRDYEYYEPAYRFGSALASEDAIVGITWNSIEADAKRRWEERNPGTWYEHREAIRHSYERERNYA